jgi:hypothetical protein
MGRTRFVALAKVIADELAARPFKKAIYAKYQAELGVGYRQFLYYVRELERAAVSPHRLLRWPWPVVLRNIRLRICRRQLRLLNLLPGPCASHSMPAVRRPSVSSSIPRPERRDRRYWRLLLCRVGDLSVGERRPSVADRGRPRCRGATAARPARDLANKDRARAIEGNKKRKQVKLSSGNISEQIFANEWREDHQSGDGKKPHMRLA